MDLDTGIGMNERQDLRQTDSSFSQHQTSLLSRMSKSCTHRNAGFRRHFEVLRRDNSLWLDCQLGFASVIGATVPTLK